MVSGRDSNEPRSPIRDPRSASGAKYLGVGVAWAASVGLFLFLGSLLDGRMDTKPVFTVVGAAIGIVAGFVSLIRQVQQDAKSDKAARSGHGPSGS